MAAQLPEQNPFCLCVMHMPGLAWSESEEGLTFREWSTNFFHLGDDYPSSFGYWMQKEPTNQQNEFVTAISIGPGGGALSKPQIACSVEVSPKTNREVREARELSAAIWAQAWQRA